MFNVSNDAKSLLFRRDDPFLVLALVHAPVLDYNQLLINS